MSKIETVRDRLNWLVADSRRICLCGSLRYRVCATTLVLQVSVTTWDNWATAPVSCDFYDDDFNFIMTSTEVTELKKAEDELREVRRKLKDKLPDMIFKGICDYVDLRFKVEKLKQGLK